MCSAILWEVTLKTGLLILSSVWHFSNDAKWRFGSVKSGLIHRFYCLKSFETIESKYSTSYSRFLYQKWYQSSSSPPYLPDLAPRFLFPKPKSSLTGDNFTQLKSWYKKITRETTGDFRKHGRGTSKEKRSNKLLNILSPSPYTNSRTDLFFFPTSLPSYLQITQ